MFWGAILVGALVFLGWLGLIGAPHFIETMIGLGLAAVSSAVAYYKLRDLQRVISNFRSKRF